MEEKPSKSLSFLQKLKEKQADKPTPQPETASMKATDCPNCGAGRAKQEGLTHCAYCGYEFIAVTLTDGIHLTKNDNSRKQ
ncbi:MAG: hypothetical protein Q4G08_11065 [Capnocytophaga sp.]|nr:hypothetical protein [Capnocytophaga sp.]MDO5608982.1 hypothetical protein [Capnocytophaga sp.]